MNPVKVKTVKYCKKHFSSQFIYEKKKYIKSLIFSLPARKFSISMNWEVLITQGC